MNLSKFNFLIMSILFFVVSTSTFAGKATGKHALLIGIQDYSNTPTFDSLKAPERDIALMKDVLRKRFRFQERDFIILHDAQATHTGIKNAFAKLNKRVRLNDFVYIHYSGHGSFTRDCNGDEPSGKDQTWVSYGARSGEKPQHQNDYDILDDEIINWLAPIYAKTDQIVFVSESCHSATVSRGETAIVKAVPPDNRTHLFCHKPYPKWVIPRGIRIGAAQDNQSAIEVAFKNDNQYYSLFTRNWAIALKQARKDDTWYDIFKHSYDKITALRQKAQTPTFSKLSQHPQMEGSRRHLALVSGFSPKQSTVTVIRVFGNRIEIDAGFADGVTKDSVYRLHQPGYSKSQNLPRLTINRVGNFQSFGFIKAKSNFKKGDLVIEEKHVYHFDPIKVYLKADKQTLYKRDNRLLQSIRTAFNKKRFPAYTLTDNPRHTEQLLSLSRSTSKKTPELWILTPDGQLLDERLKIPFNNKNKGLKLLQINLNKLARIRELKLLGTDRYDFFVGNLQIWHSRPVNYCQSADSTCIRNREHGKYYRIIGESNLKRFQEYASLKGNEVQKGDVLIFELRNTSDKDYHFYLIEISPDGTIQSLFPDSGEVQQTYSKIKAGKSLFRIRRLVLTQTGEATLKLIATHEPIEVSLLEENRFARSGIQKELNPLERLLFNAMQGKRTRVGISNFQWAAEQVSFEVK